MKIEPAFLRSRVARRIFFLFLVCAILPILVLAVVSFVSVNRELEEQSRQRLQELSKTLAMAVVERLAFLDVELQLVSENLVGAPAAIPEPLADSMRGRFRNLAIALDGELGVVLGGPTLDPPDLTTGQLTHLDSGQPLLVFDRRPPDHGTILLARGISAGGSRAVVWGEVDPLFLWWGPERDNHLPALTEMCILEAVVWLRLFCAPSETTGVPQEALGELADSALGGFSWSRAGTDFLSRFRTVNLEARYGTSGITVVVSETASEALRPIADFRRSFPLVLLIALWVVLLLSVVQIRRQLVPLERLQRGTRRIASREFDTRVRVASGDEFQELADSFNAMAAQLGKQFGALTAQSEIVQAILAALDTDTVASTVLARLGSVLPCRRAALVLVSRRSPGRARLILGSGNPPAVVEERRLTMAPEDLTRLERHPQLLETGIGEGLPEYLQGFPTAGLGSLLLFPIFLESRPAAVLVAGIPEGAEFEDLDLDHGRKVADQVAVALANAHLVEDLDQLSWGTLQALARVIDAKSHWTLGHSERVAYLAISVGRRLGLSPLDLESLRRGSLLHDIGKIGVSSSILDKPGRLTAEEIEIMRGHTRVGARILEPIPPLANAIPLVLQHHEWVNGAGYPQGLKGDEISRGARILAVVDCYDALRSPRPYRPPFSHEWVVEWLEERRGVQFEPAVLDAFLQVLDEEGIPAMPIEGPTAPATA